MTRTRDIYAEISRKVSRHGQRRGAALVELVLCLPLLILVLLMAIQTADVVYLKQSLHIAAYESARAAIKPTSTTPQALAPGEQILANRRVRDYSIEFTPADVSSVPPGEVITVRVTTRIDRNTVLPTWYPGGHSLSAQAFMNKE